MKKLIFILLALLTMVSSAFAQIGSIDKDLVFTPVNPCRLFDTRSSQGGTGAIAAAGVKNLLVWGQSSYTAQGGAASDCGLLAAGSNVAAVAINLTVVSPATGGYITAYPFGTALPTAATVNFVGGDIVRGNFTVAKINQGAGLFHLTIYSSSLADVVGDVVGYYSKPVATGSFECVNVFNTVATVVPVGSVAVVSDSSIVACPATYTGINYIWDYAGGSGGIGIWRNVYGSNISFSHAPFSTVTTGYANLNLLVGRRCCRIPGR